jgi:hypothetical protein
MEEAKKSTVLRQKSDYSVISEAMHRFSVV